MGIRDWHYQKEVPPTCLLATTSFKVSNVTLEIQLLKQNILGKKTLRVPFYFYVQFRNQKTNS